MVFYELDLFTFFNFCLYFRDKSLQFEQLRCCLINLIICYELLQRGIYRSSYCIYLCMQLKLIVTNQVFGNLVFWYRSLQMMQSTHRKDSYMTGVLNYSVPWFSVSIVTNRDRLQHQLYITIGLIGIALQINKYNLNWYKHLYLIILNR